MSPRRAVRILAPLTTAALLAFVLSLALLPTAIPGIYTATIATSLATVITSASLLMALLIGGGR